MGHVRGRLAAVEFFDGAFGQGPGLQFFDRLAAEVATADKERALFALERDAVLSVVTDNDLGAVGILASDEKRRGSVVAVGNVGVGGGSFDRDRTSVIGAD